ncbi:MAG: hypothetical protein KA163_04490 [Bacteroidia bacterium]|nr:hypothetical protein [Bacteroidia bacterium]
MKKLIITIFLLASLVEVNAQFFRGIGIFVGVNQSRHRYKNLLSPTKDNNNPQFNAFYPQNHHSAEYFSYATGLFLEFLRYDHIRWQTELEYTQKGAVEQYVTNWVTGERNGGSAANIYKYIQWNNYLKFMQRTGRKGQAYLMVGAKIEYLLSFAAPVFPEVAGTFPKIWFSGDVGVGWEWFATKKWHPFIEFHWNPDIGYQPPRANTAIRNRTFELRIGVIFRPLPKSIDDCNAPKYHGNYY